MTRVLVLIPILAFLLVVITMVSGAQEGKTDVNIEKYIEFRMEFDHGERLHLEARVEASPYPVSVFLVKGEEAYSDWVESEDVSVQDILDGKNVSEMNVTYQVIENFSEDNITFFDGSIDIGDRDTYFLIIALYRTSSMSTDEIMTMASEVDYVVDWRVEDSDVPWGLLVFSLVFLILGVGFIIAYFISRSRYREKQDPDEGPDECDRRGPAERPGERRAPPMRR
ncbi:MAG: hypothetical protein JXA22_08430 [Candidatus Thermoplasmatota archaeon]|nr:hypothetical protein [Candidatus Thermoplasmatota archaeon]